jgi:hypothetical protein
MLHLSKSVILNVKGPNDYQLHPKRIIIGLILIKQKYYLQLAWKLVQAQEFSILLDKCRKNYFLIQIYIVIESMSSDLLLLNKNFQ